MRPPIIKKIVIKTIIAAGIFIGSIQPASANYSDYCREYNYNVSIGNAPAPAYGTACYQPDGSWKIGEREVQQTSYYNQQPAYVNHVSYITTRRYVQPPLFSISFGNHGHYYPRYYNHHRNKHWNNHRRDNHHYHKGRSGRSYVKYKPNR